MEQGCIIDFVVSYKWSMFPQFYLSDAFMRYPVLINIFWSLSVVIVGTTNFIIMIHCVNCRIECDSIFLYQFSYEAVGGREI